MSKVTTVNDITAIDNYAGEYQAEIITSVLNGIDIAQDVTLIRNLDTPRTLSKYTGNKGLRPLDTDVRTPDGKSGSFGVRTITPRTSMKIIDVVPEELRKTFLGRDLTANATEYPKGFSQYFWKEQGDTIASEINDEAYLSVDPEKIAAFNEATSYTVGSRVHFEKNYYRCVTATTAAQSPTTHPAKWLKANGECLGDGFGTIIAADYSLMAPSNKIATGAITALNAFDQFTTFYMSIPAAKQKLGGIFYVSYDLYQKYSMALLEKFKTGTSAFQVPGSVSLYLFGSANKWIIKPCTWMGNSQRIIATQYKNLVMGTDQLSDLNTIGKMVPHIHGATYKYQMILAFQIADLSTLFVNDLA